MCVCVCVRGGGASKPCCYWKQADHREDNTRLDTSRRLLREHMATAVPPGDHSCITNMLTKTHSVKTTITTRKNFKSLFENIIVFVKTKLYFLHVHTHSLHKYTHSLSLYTHSVCIHTLTHQLSLYTHSHKLTLCIHTLTHKGDVEGLVPLDKRETNYAYYTQGGE